jgi:ABC-type sulfate/molybdate transport systems ATPase subunit
MLKVNSISFSFLDEKTLSKIDFSLKKGKILAIIGESGCGKSTLLKLIYGLFDLDEGHIFWNEIEVLGPKFNLIPGMDFMKYLAQDFDLMPFITVAENVGKYLSNIDSEKKQQRIYELLELVEMTEFASTKAKNLSGGQMQRVALARVLALKPEVLLLDEPFSHIDNFRKNTLRRKLFTYFKENNITAIIATHDSNDVLSFTDELIVLQNGKLIEYGNPNSIYFNPKSKYIASLFDDINQIEINGKTHFVYPHQFKIVAFSDLQVKVTNCYFRGKNYLIESKYNNAILFFESKLELNLHETIFLEISKTSHQ